MHTQSSKMHYVAIQHTYSEMYSAFSVSAQDVYLELF